MSSSSGFHEDKFSDVAQQWDLDRLYADLATAKQRLLTRTERVCLRGLLQGLSPKDIAIELDRQPQGLQVDLTRGLYRYIETLTQVAVRNWREVATTLEQCYRRPVQPTPANSATSDRTLVPSICQDWGKAPEVFTFFGRSLELAELEQWIMTDRYRLVAILGMGGMGKTSLSLKLAQRIQDQFECVIWRSLLNAPLLQDLLTDLLQTLSGQQAVTTILTDLDGAISQLLQHLHTHRCLLVLDNVETVLQADTATGYYRPGYESYSQLFHQIGTVPHQSCLLLTSREPPEEITQLEGKMRPVRSLKLRGLSVSEGKQLLAEMGEFAATEPKWQQLIKLYDGNPLVLELVGKHIADMFSGNVTVFLDEGTPVFHDLKNLLDWHFDRLTAVEQEVMYWLAINREPVTIAELKEDILSPTAKRQAAATLQLLQRRFPLERQGNGFTQQPIVMEYVTNRLIEQLCNEVITANIQYFNQYTFLKAQTKDYIRESQKRIFVETIVANLQTHLHNRPAIISQLKKVLRQLREQFAELPGYGGGNLINLLCHLKVDLTEYDFSHLSIWQAHLTETKLHRVNFAGANLAKSVFAETFGGITCVAFSPDGKRLATSDTSGKVQVWQGATGQQQLAFKADTVWTWAVAFSPNGKMLASAGDDYQVKLWDAQTGECLQILQGHSNTVNAIAFNPAGNLLASCGQDATIRLWSVDPRSETQNAVCVGILQGHQGRVWSIAFSPEGQTIASGSEDRTLKLWDIRTGACLKTWTGHDAWVKSVAYSPDGRWIASGSFDGVVKVWQVSTGACHHTWKNHQSVVTAVTFCPAPSIKGLPKNLLASSSYDQTVKLRDIETGTCLRTWQAHDNRIWFITFSPDGQLLASGGEDHTTRLWDVQTGYCCKTWKGHTNGILSLALNSDHTILATGHEDQTVKLWHPETGEILKVLRGHTNRVWSVALAPQTTNHSSLEILASASADRTIKLWNSRTGDCLRTLEGHQSWVWSVAFSPTGDRLASGSYDQTIRLWEPHTGECLNTLVGHTAPIVSVTFSPDGQWLASSSFDTLIKLWHISTGRCIQTFQGHDHSVWSVVFSPDGQQLASCSYDKTVKLWNLDSGQCTRTLVEHTNPVICIAFSPDGKQIASGSFDRTIRLWEIRSGKLLHTFCGHTGPVSSLLFASPTPATLNCLPLILSSSFDETIRVWDGETGRHLKTWRERRPYEGINITNINGLSESQRATLHALGAIED